MAQLASANIAPATASQSPPSWHPRSEWQTLHLPGELKNGPWQMAAGRNSIAIWRHGQSHVCVVTDEGHSSHHADRTRSSGGTAVHDAASQHMQDTRTDHSRNTGSNSAPSKRARAHSGDGCSDEDKGSEAAVPAGRSSCSNVACKAIELLEGAVSMGCGGSHFVAATSTGVHLAL